jgi:transposase
VIEQLNPASETEGYMVKNGKFFVIKEMHAKGMYVTHIAKEVGRDPKTIRKLLGQTEPCRYQRSNRRIGKLDTYKGYVPQRMEDGCLNAVVIYDEIKTKGYIGSVTTLRYFMRPLKPIISSKASERFETEPGEQAQVDWGHFRVDWNQSQKRLYAFVRVLGYSRTLYVEYTEDEKVETLIGCHESFSMKLCTASKWSNVVIVLS